MKGSYILLAVVVLAGATVVAALFLLLGFDRAQQLVDIANKLALTVAAIVGGY